MIYMPNNCHNQSLNQIQKYLRIVNTFTTWLHADNNNNNISSGERKVPTYIFVSLTGKSIYIKARCIIQSR